ncbi:hypothetical protein FRIG_15780 [Frigoribacterium faeni]|nr:hypothetical protein [Frigoribacterium faeni]MCJ0702571.1 hypothetical protein [Frigoribacterium faeni]
MYKRQRFFSSTSKSTPDTRRRAMVANSANQRFASPRGEANRRPSPINN